MAEAKEKPITFFVRRYHPEVDSEPYYQTFTVPVKRGMTVLEGLHWIKQNLDNTLAWRYSCRMGVCGSCAMMINGKPTLACNTQILHVSTKAIALAPLPNFPLIRDLVPDLSPMFEKHRALKPFILRDEESLHSTEGEFEQSPEELEAYLQFAYCIRCGACMAACPTLSLDPQYFGPMPLAQLYRYVKDTRDDGFKERLTLASQAGGVSRCHYAGECSRVCPKGVDPARAIQFLKREMVLAYFKLMKKPACSRMLHEGRTTGRRLDIPEAPKYTV